MAEGRGTQLIPVHQVYTIFLGFAVSSEPVARLMSVCICSNSLAADYRSLPAPIYRSSLYPSSMFPHFHSPILPFPLLVPPLSPPPRHDSTRLPPRFVAAQCHVTWSVSKENDLCRSRSISNSLAYNISFLAQMPRACNTRKQSIFEIRGGCLFDSIFFLFKIIIPINNYGNMESRTFEETRIWPVKNLEKIGPR